MDGWAYVSGKSEPLDSLERKLAREYPGYVFVSREPMTTGLWLDCHVLTPTKEPKTLRLYF